MFKRVFILLVIASIPVSAMAASKSDKRRAEIIEMRDEVLSDLYKHSSSAKSEVKSSIGYAVFTNVGVNVIFVSGGGGKVVAHDNETGVNTYMKMGSAGVGLGLGIKDFRAVFIFHTRKAFDQFVDKGWDFSGQADAAAKSGDKGGEVNVAADIGSGVTVYQLTETGLALQATLQGTKYWQYDKLN